MKSTYTGQLLITLSADSEIRAANSQSDSWMSFVIVSISHSKESDDISDAYRDKISERVHFNRARSFDVHPE